MRRFRSNGSLLLGCVVASVLVANSGCVALVAGAAAAGGATGYAYYKGKVTRTYVAAFDDVWAATRTALGELQMPIVAEERSGLGGTIESKNGSDKVQITFDVQRREGEGTLTQVGVRVATFGDDTVSNRLFDQLGRHLVPATPALPKPPAATPGGVTLSRPVETPPPPLANPGK